MSQDETTAEAISLLQELGLQEYEARCFMALNKLPSGTAKEIHEISDVPRTRVYDAIRVLESQGLVEVQHSSPQVYRAVSVTEATQTLRRKYTDRIETLETHLENTDVQDGSGDDDRVQEVWSLIGHEAIEARTLDLIDEADSEIALIVVDEEILTEPLFDGLQEAGNRNISILLGGQTEAVTETLGRQLPNLRIFETGLDWLTSGRGDDVAISRILLVDRETLLVGSYYPDADGAEAKEQAIFASGLENGFVVLLRRLVTSGLAATQDPGK
ncbi:TrmB family transcriptional regulator [Halosolutus amylolyticus]|uniref:TrmB family transcriptional regulator n=1 Tax=Halosolutus amylolyticus TaxID=2932267 RepID=A0ABD5PSY9_9EURY|nr:helix-turn-helix domain-containing protein [Halosolutus amylolyticus]